MREHNKIRTQQACLIAYGFCCARSERFKRSRRQRRLNVIHPTSRLHRRKVWEFQEPFSKGSWRVKGRALTGLGALPRPPPNLFEEKERTSYAAKTFLRCSREVGANFKTAASPRESKSALTNNEARGAAAAGKKHAHEVRRRKKRRRKII